MYQQHRGADNGGRESALNQPCGVSPKMKTSTATLENVQYSRYGNRRVEGDIAWRMLLQQWFPHSRRDNRTG